MKIPFSHWYITSLSLIFILTSCIYQQIEPILPPGPGVESVDLEAEFSGTPPITFSHPAWFLANYKSVDMMDVLTGQVNPTDGVMNVSGTFDGLSQFNKGKEPQLILKAAYDSENIYIYASWQDESFNLSQRSWVYNGPADPEKVDDPMGWTSQRSDDKIEFKFEMASDKFDVWKWSLALSEPLGFAIDMIEDGDLTVDAGDLIFRPNLAGENFRSGPKYEWDGSQQELTRELGGFTILDPSYFLLNKTEVAIDAMNGEIVFQQKCAECHGTDGNGGDAERPLNRAGEFTGVTFNGFEAMVDLEDHSGQSAWNSINLAQKEELHARIKAFSGIPGYYLENSPGTVPDIKSRSNILLGRVTGKNREGYEVLLVRKLNTGSTDDINFDPKVENYSFNVNLYDNDEINKIGSDDIINLVFK